MHDEASLLLMFPNVEFLSSPVYLPIHQLEVVSFAVLPVADRTYAVAETQGFPASAVGSRDTLLDK